MLCIPNGPATLRPVEGMIVYDIVRSGLIYYTGTRWRPMEGELFTKWECPNMVNFTRLISELSFGLQDKKCEPFITPEDLVLMELLNNVDPELLLENKEIMRKFETVYRFFRSLV